MSAEPIVQRAWILAAKPGGAGRTNVAAERRRDPYEVGTGCPQSCVRGSQLPSSTLSFSEDVAVKIDTAKLESAKKRVDGLVE